MGADPLKGAPLKGLDKRDAIRKDEILSAIVKSGRSYEEIMNFLNGIDKECTTAEAVVRVLGGKFLEVHIGVTMF